MNQSTKICSFWVLATCGFSFIIQIGCKNENPTNRNVETPTSISEQIESTTYQKVESSDSDTENKNPREKNRQSNKIKGLFYYPDFLELSNCKNHDCADSVRFP